MTRNGCLIIVGLLLFSCSKEENPVKSDEPRGQAFVAPAAQDTSLSFFSFNMAVGFSAESLILSNLRSPRTVLVEGRALYDELLASRPRERMRVLADSVARLSPDIIGFQEVLYLENRHEGVTLDFLNLFLAALDSLNGPDYAVLRQVMNPIPIKVTVADSDLVDSVDIYFHEGNAILYKSPLLSPTATASMVFFNGIKELPYLTSTLSILRGALYARLATRRNTFIDVYNTHLEVGGLFLDIGYPQAVELVEYINGKSSGDPAIVAMGDFNDAPGGRRLGKFLEARFADSYAGNQPTCCYEFTDPAAQASRRLDYILVKNVVDTSIGAVRLTGTFRTDSVECRISDHAAASAVVTFH